MVVQHPQHNRQLIFKACVKKRMVSIEIITELGHISGPLRNSKNQKHSEMIDKTIFNVCCHEVILSKL